MPNGIIAHHIVWDGLHMWKLTRKAAWNFYLDFAILLNLQTKAFFNNILTLYVAAFNTHSFDFDTSSFTFSTFPAYAQTAILRIWQEAHDPNNIAPKTCLHITGDVNYFLWHTSRHGAVIILRPRRNGRRYADDILKHIFFNENVCILIELYWNVFMITNFSDFKCVASMIQWFKRKENQHCYV